VHLERLLNARRGTLVHLPDYGMPDLADVYESLPYSVDGLVAAVKSCIETYEPRLRRVQVRHLRRSGSSIRLQLEISAEVIGGGMVHYQTCFESGGAIQVDAPRQKIMAAAR